MDLYHVLGINKNANPAQIKSAYHRRAQETHPDHINGSEEDIKAVNVAYEILIDDEKRKKYDESGQISEDQDEDEIIRDHLSNIFLKITVGKDFNAMSSDLFKLMNEDLYKSMSESKKNIKKLNLDIELYVRIKERIKSKDTESFFHNVAQNEINGFRDNINHLEIDLTRAEKALKYLKDFKYDVLDLFNDPDLLDWKREMLGEGMDYKRLSR